MKRVLMGLMLLSSLFLSNVSHAGYAEGTPFSAGNTNTTPAPDAYGQIVRIVGGSKCKATAAPPSYSEGDEVPLSCELDGDLRTNATGGGGSGDASLAEQQTQTGILGTIDADTGTIAGAVKAEDAAHSSGHTGIPFWGVRNDSASTSLTDTNGDYTPIATDSNGRLFINAISSIFSVTPGTTTTALGKAEDAAHASGDTGVMSLCVRQDTAAALAGTDGDYIPCSTDANGRIHTTNPAVDGTKIRAMLVDSSGAEVVMPTAGLTHFDAADASTNSTNVLNAAGTVYHYSLTNTTTTVYYLRMYNSASAPTCSSATGFVESIPIPPASAAGQVGGRERVMNIGQAFTTGISYCITASSGSTANDAAAAGVFVTLLYKAN